MKKPENTPEPGQSTRCGAARVKYDPNWCKTFPYCVFRNGTAGNIHDNLQDALIDAAGPDSEWSNWS